MQFLRILNNQIIVNNDNALEKVMNLRQIDVTQPGEYYPQDYNLEGFSSFYLEPNMEFDDSPYIGARNLIFRNLKRTDYTYFVIGTTSTSLYNRVISIVYSQDSENNVTTIAKDNNGRADDYWLPSSVIHFSSSGLEIDLSSYIDEDLKFTGNGYYCFATNLPLQQEV